MRAELIDAGLVGRGQRELAEGRDGDDRNCRAGSRAKMASGSQIDSGMTTRLSRAALGRSTRVEVSAARTAKPLSVDVV